MEPRRLNFTKETKNEICIEGNMIDQGTCACQPREHATSSLTASVKLRLGSSYVDEPSIAALPPNLPTKIIL